MRWFRQPSANRNARRVSGASLAVERLETRDLPAIGFLQGYALIDTNNNGIFELGVDAPKTNVSIQLKNAANGATLQTALTNAEGYYRFDNVAAGSYQIVENTPAQYAPVGTTITSWLNPGSQASPNTINVTVPSADPANLKLVRTPGIAGGYAGVNTAYTLNGGAFNSFTSQPHGTNAHQFQFDLTGGSPSTTLLNDAYGYCMDLFHASPATFGVVIASNPAIPGSAQPPLSPTTLANIGRIGYLYNHFGSKLAANSADGAGLALAFYELIYDSADNLSAGNLVVNQATTDPAAYAAAQLYLNLSVSKDERAIFLNVPANVAAGTFGSQGMLATETYSFLNKTADTYTIRGTKYTDQTGDGINAGDTPLAGITINLYSGTNASGTLVGTTTTAADGTYSFAGLGLGTYFVQEEVPAGYVQTAGNAGYIVTIGVTGTTGGQLDHNDFANFQKVTISGTKFNDITGNSFSGDDTPLGGVTINLFKDGGAVPVASTVTAGDGSYSFVGLEPGTYFVQEVVPAGSVQTGGNSGYTIVATSGTDAANKNFANFQKVTISGTKFNDITGNSFSGDDTPLGGVTINLFKDGGAVPVASTVTAGDGSYSFVGLEPGTYFVQEVVPAGSVQTGGNSGYVIVASSGQNKSGNNFANFQKVTISGTKFNDITGNSFSGDDTPLGGVTINLFKDGGAVPVASTVTAGDGSYSFTGLEPGTYFVQEVVPAGSVQTGGNSGYTIVAKSGTDAANKNFANFQKVTISGTKFNDITGNSFSGDDTPLGGVTINLFKDGGAVPVASTVTAGDGSYSFTGLEPGTYFVQEVVPAGSVQTGGNSGYVIVASSGQNKSGNNFANFQKVTISGTKFNDITGNSFSGDDTPLGGVTINLFKDGGAVPVASTVTAGDGSYSFTGLEPGTYFVQEVVPAGSVQTGGNSGYTIVAKSGTNSTGNDFDNFKKVKITGTKVTDKTGNGYTGDDTGLGGVTIHLYAGSSAAGTFITSTTTASDGTFSFNNLAPGTYFVQEVVPGGYVQTGGATGYVVVVGTDVQSGGTSVNNNFANFKLVKITGTKFQDFDGCGFGSDDAPLGGVTINLYKGTSTAGEFVTSTVTASDGTFSFTGLVPGTYFVQEVVPVGWTQTGGNAGYVVTVGGTGVQSGGTASGKNFDNYKKPNPGIDIEKTTNGPTNSNPTAPNYDNEDTADGAGVPILTPGSTVTWTYKVTNTGDVAFTTSQITIVDDNGTPGTTSDDLSIANGKITFQSVQTGDADNILEPGEVWLYKASGVVQDFSVPVSGSPVAFDFSGNTAVTGPSGNVRSFTSSGVSVNASAFSRDKSSGAWSTAYLGAYGGGLGVTDGSEDGSSSSHTVDNSGRDNYVLFEFSEKVIIDSAFLGYVVGDSDLTVWIGTKTDPFNSHLTLSDALLTSLGFTEVNLGGSSTRTANLNAALLAGNVLIIAAKTGDSDDKFKIETLCLQKVKPGVYQNKATVKVPGDEDSDLSHYKNPPAVVGGSISGTKYLDVSGNGLNKTAGTYSPADTPLAGVTIYLDLDNDGQLDAGEPKTLTDANGNYLFTGLTSKTYYVREVVPEGFVRTGPVLTDHYAVTVSGGKSYTGYDFANAEACEECVADTITSVSYTICHADGTRETVSDLRGRTREGDVITVTFKVNVPVGQTQQVTFVSYTAPGADFDANTASQQKIYDLDTDEFGPGYHTLTVRIPNCYYQVDFVCGFAIDKFGPAGSNIFYTPQKRLESADNGGTECCDNDGTISGYKYNDKDADGVWDSGETALSGWVIYLDGNNNGRKDSWEAATTTDGNGYYKFNNLAAGTHRVREVQQSGWVQSTALADVALTTGQNKSGVNFGNVAGSRVSNCDTASIDFWNCPSGQNLIKSLNGGSTKTALGGWLASNFSKLYGSSSSYNLSGKTNAQVASYFQTLAGKSDKLEAQILATALAVYVTDSDLAGGTYARNYGFSVTTTGIANEFYNIGTNGSLFGVANGGVRTVWQILVAANNSAVGGLAWSGNSAARTATRTLFAGLNDVGGIG